MLVFLRSLAVFWILGGAVNMYLWGSVDTSESPMVASLAHMMFLCGELTCAVGIAGFIGSLLADGSLS